MSDSINTIKSFERRINENKGKPNNYPECMNYRIKDQNAVIELVKGFSKKELRRFDSWALAFISEAEDKIKIKITKVTFIIKQDVEDFKYDFESFRRRVSYINVNNAKLLCEIKVQNKIIKLYDRQSLFNRPEYEIIRSDIKDRSDQDKGYLLEKAFQAFLFGKDLGKKNSHK